MKITKTEIALDKSKTMIKKTKKARFIVCSPKASSCPNLSSLAGTERTICIDDRISNKLANANIRGAIARSIYKLVDQYDIS